MYYTLLAAKTSVPIATVTVSTLPTRGDAVGAYADPAIMRLGW
jgi:hypothetical protein